jgi:outer membrane receptor for ferrienterochelin and colicins
VIAAVFGMVLALASPPLAAPLAGADLHVADGNAAHAFTGQGGVSGTGVRVTVTYDARPVLGAVVTSGEVRATTGSDGDAFLALGEGAHRVVVQRIGFRPDTASVVVSRGAIVALAVSLERAAEELERVVIATTRSERDAEQSATRVDVLEREEIEEKMLMTPGDIAMMLNETGGVRVQTTSPSLGGARVRIHGMSGRYTLLLSDGLPLYGGQSGGLGLLQIPPMDLGRVELIKGAASALYGPAALGGVVNLISRRAGDEPERELLLNQTTQGGTDGVLWLSGPVTDATAYTLLAGAHRQSRRDLDRDGWTDVPGYERIVVRPRVHFTLDGGGSVLVTAGVTDEARTGGTLEGRVAPDGLAFAEELHTRRVDAGLIARLQAGESGLVTARLSAMGQRHRHQFGTVRERDRHSTMFGEVALATQHAWGASVLGASLERDRYVARDVEGFDYTHTIPSAFGQLERDVSESVSLALSARVDAHSDYGTLAHPRLSALYRAPRDWMVRASFGAGAFAPTPFTDETEVTGLSVVVPPSGLRAERAVTGSLGAAGPLGEFEAGVTVFASRVTRPLTVGVAPDDRLTLVNAAEPVRVAGADTHIRWGREPFAVTAAYTFVRATESDPVAGDRVRRLVPLTPRHTAGVVAMWEAEGEGRAGLEFYYTGIQSLDDNPYRSNSRSYVIVGALVERRFGPARVFVNAENLGGVRQTRYDPLVRPTPGRGGRWTTDSWTELTGRVFNAGVRLAIGG